MMLPCLIAMLLAAIQLGDPKKSDLHIRAARMLFEKGVEAARDNHTQQAVALFQQSIQIEPTYLEARRGLIAAYSALGEDLHEAAAITEYLEIQPDSFQDRLRLGQLLLAQKQLRKALAQFSLALQTNPDNPDALLGFASAASQLGIEDRAEQALARGRQRYPNDKRFLPAHSSSPSRP